MAKLVDGACAACKVASAAPFGKREPALRDRQRKSRDRRMIRSFAVAAGVCALAAGSPVAASEVFVGAFAHAVPTHISAGDEEHGVDGELGWRSERIESWGKIGRPRVYALVSKNFSGQTDFASVGLLWRHDFSRKFYGQAGIGVAIHDGVAYPRGANGRKDVIVFGSRILFQPELSVGVRLSDRVSLEAAYVHISNGHIWTKINPGMDDLGGRLVYRFGG
jgi:hypothetical protein